MMRVLIPSVTEGEDEPLQYPDMFAASRLMFLGSSPFADCAGCYCYDSV